MAIKKSIKLQQKKAKTYQSNKVSTLEESLEIDPNIYDFKYIVRPDGSYTISRIATGPQWSVVNLEIDYKQLRAWRQDKGLSKQKDSNSFSSKYVDIDFNI